jgi:hypothetical protein
MNDTIPHLGHAVIVLDDDRLSRAEASLIRSELEDLGWEVDAAVVDRFGQLRHGCSEKPWDVVIAVSRTRQATRIAATVGAVLVHASGPTLSVGRQIPGLKCERVAIAEIETPEWRSIVAEHVDATTMAVDAPLQVTCPSFTTALAAERIMIDVADLYCVKPPATIIEGHATLRTWGPDQQTNSAVGAKDELTIAASGDSLIAISIDSGRGIRIRGPATFRTQPGALRVARIGTD